MMLVVFKHNHAPNVLIVFSHLNIKISNISFQVYKLALQVTSSLVFFNQISN